MNMTEFQRKATDLWLTARINFHRAIMDSESGVTRKWKAHARKFGRLCRARGELLTDEERSRIERREGLV
jgi:hypothetical protein